MTTVFGIDLGTTNTVISYFDENKSKILTDGAFKLIPSKIYISPDNKIYCGNYIPIGAKNIINSFKEYVKYDDYYYPYLKFNPELIMDKFNKIFLS